MKHIVVVLGLLVFAVPAWGASDEAEKLINDYNRYRVLCSGGTDDAADSACERIRNLGPELTELGYCYAPIGQLWLRCPEGVEAGPSQGQARFFGRAHKLLEWCVNHDGEIHNVIGTVDGIRGSYAAEGLPDPFCIPNYVLSEDLAHVVCSYVKLQPMERMDQAAAVLTFEATREAYPCN